MTAPRPHPELPDWTLGLLMGGSSRRMGRDKALLPWDGSTLAEASCRACRPANGQVLLAVGTPERPVPSGLLAFPRIYDRRHGRGPLAAIEVLLESCLSPYLIVVPCDMIGLERADLEALLAFALGAEAALACVDGQPWPHTFPLVLDVAALRGRCAPLFAEGPGRVLDLARLGRFVKAPESLLGGSEVAGRKLRNLNDEAAYRAALGAGSLAPDAGA